MLEFARPFTAGLSRPWSRNPRRLTHRLRRMPLHRRIMRHHHTIHMYRTGHMDIGAAGITVDTIIGEVIMGMDAMGTGHNPREKELGSDSIIELHSQLSCPSLVVMSRS